VDRRFFLWVLSFNADNTTGLTSGSFVGVHIMYHENFTRLWTYYLRLTIILLIADTENL